CDVPVRPVRDDVRGQKPSARTLASEFLEPGAQRSPESATSGTRMAGPAHGYAARPGTRATSHDPGAPDRRRPLFGDAPAPPPRTVRRVGRGALVRHPGREPCEPAAGPGGPRVVAGASARSGVAALRPGRGCTGHARGRGRRRRGEPSGYGRRPRRGRPRPPPRRAPPDAGRDGAHRRSSTPPRVLPR